MSTPAETIAVTPEARKALLEAAAASGTPQIQLASQALVAGLAPEQRAITPLGAPQEPTIDDAAVVFLRYLHPAQAELILAICEEEHRRPSQYLLGYAALAYDRGETAQFLAEDDHRAVDATARAFVGATLPCAWCNQPFIAARPGQKYCPDPAESAVMSCGKQATQAELHQRRPRKAAPARQAAMRGVQPEPVE